MFNLTDNQQSLWADLVSNAVNLDIFHPWWVDGYTKLNDYCSFSKNLDFNLIQKLISKNSEWQIVFTDVRYLEPEPWFRFLSRKELPITKEMRNLSHKDYANYPDLFHDVFGHVPLMLNVDYLEKLHKFAVCFLSRTGREQEKTLVDWWFSMEFGVIKQKDSYKVIGAGIISSKLEQKELLANLNSSSVISYSQSELSTEDFYHHEIHPRYYYLTQDGFDNII